MPPEQDDNRERQLAALRRYVSDLDIRRREDDPERVDLQQRRRPAWPWLLATLVLMAVSLAGGIAIGDNRGRASSTDLVGATATSVTATPSASPECAEAVERANETIGHAVKISGALHDHTEVMNDLLQGRIDSDTALKTGTPSLIVGSAESAKFDLALADYRKVVDACKLRPGP
jgi:hypothetical protein